MSIDFTTVSVKDLESARDSWIEKGRTLSDTIYDNIGDIIETADDRDIDQFFLALDVIEKICEYLDTRRSRVWFSKPSKAIALYTPTPCYIEDLERAAWKLYFINELDYHYNPF